MIQVKINDLLNSVETLQKLSKKDFKAKLAWQVARLLKSVESEIQSFNETRMNLINKYGEKGEDGQLITDEAGNCKIAPEVIETFTNELNDLLDSEVEINANKLDFAKMEDLDFTPSDMIALQPFVEMEDE